MSDQEITALTQILTLIIFQQVISREKVEFDFRY